MKVGLSLEPFKGMDVEKIIPLLRLLQIEHVEFNSRIIPFVDKVIPKLKNLTTTLHLPIYNRDRFDFSSTDNRFDITIDEIITFINTHHHEMNMLFTLSHPPEGKNTSFKLLMERLQQVETPIILENIIGQTDKKFMDFYFQAKDYLGRQLAGHVIDVPHRYVTDFHNWLNIPKELLEEIIYVHISDCTKKEDLHRPLGMAALPFEEFFSLLKRINFQGIILQELKPNANEIAEIIESCLHCWKPFNKRKYILVKMLSTLVQPVVRMKVNHTYKYYLQNGIKLSAAELAYDFC